MAVPPPNRSPARRAARAALVAAAFLVTGAVTTVMVAWACAIWAPEAEFKILDIQGRQVGTLGETLDIPPSVSRWTPLSWTRPSEQNLGGSLFGIEFQMSGPGLHSFRFEVDEISGPSSSFMPRQVVQVQRTGWPFAAMCSVGRWPHRDPLRRFPGSFTWQHATIVPEWLSPAGMRGAALPSNGEPRPLPLRPIPLGFIGDAAIYAVLLFAATVAPARARRSLRRRRNLCPSCGYSLAGLADGGKCPECGGDR